MLTVYVATICKLKKSHLQIINNVSASYTHTCVHVHNESANVAWRFLRRFRNIYFVSLFSTCNIIVASNYTFKLKFVRIKLKINVTS